MSGCKKTRCSKCCIPKAKPVEPIILASGLLGVADGKLALLGGKSIASLAEGTPAPGIRSWLVTFDTTIRPTPSIATLAQQADMSIPFFQPRFRATAIDPLVVLEFYLIDGAGALLDPISTFTSGFAGVHFSALRAGNQVFTAP